MLKDTDFSAAGKMTVPELFARRLEETPDRVIVRSVRGDMTVAQWHQRALSFREIFADQTGILKGQRVAIWMSSDEALAYLGAMQATYDEGAIVVPLDDRMAVEEVKRVFEHLRPRLLVIGEIVFQRVKGELSRILSKGGESYELSAGSEAGVIRIKDAHADGDPVSWAPRDAADRAYVTGIQPDANAFVAFTSGSTGRPKAAMWTHATISQYAERVSHATYCDPRGGRQYGADDVLQSPIPVYTGASMFENVYPTVFAGATAVFEGRRFDPMESLNRMAANKTTVYNGVPPHLAMMCERDNVAGAAPDLILTSGSPITDDLYRRVRNRWPSTVVVNWYGLNESGTGQIINYGHDMDADSQAIGREVWPTEVMIVDPDGHEVAEGEAGELWMRAPGQLTEYYGQPEKTAEMLHDGWLKTGDYAYRGPTGLIRLAGRHGERINRGGFKFYPAEVEAALERHPAIRKASVFGVPHPVLGQDTVAFVELLDSVDEKTLRDFCKREVAANKAPSQIFVLKELPLGVYGKVDKKKLLALYKNGATRLS